jgi:hypothetical protein
MDIYILQYKYSQQAKLQSSRKGSRSTLYSRDSYFKLQPEFGSLDRNFLLFLTTVKRQ